MLLISCNFPKTKNARSREMEIVKQPLPRTAILSPGRPNGHINLDGVLCLLTLLRPPVWREISIIRIYMHIIDFL